MEPNSAAPLREMWYYAMPSRQLRRGRTLARVFLGEPLLFARSRDGQAFALRDICPHRGVLLSEGRYDGAEIECPFHGWRFEASGRCTAIPSLVGREGFDPGKIRVRSYPVKEVHGNLWIFFGSAPEAAPEVPLLPELDAGRQPDLRMSMRVRCAIDDAVFGQMDPTHNPFVHVSWWWRRHGSITAKEKLFAPAPYGFTMLPHKPSGTMLPYKLLGGAPRTQIIFRLPSTRIEHAHFGKHQFVTLNTATPTVDGEIEMSYCAYWTPKIFTVIKPIFLLALRTFAGQDRRILELQSRGLKYKPALLLIDDADTQAKWYHRLKNEYARACLEKRPFVNPLKERVLQFRS